MMDKSRSLDDISKALCFYPELFNYIDDEVILSWWKLK